MNTKKNKTIHTKAASDRDGQNWPADVEIRKYRAGDIKPLTKAGFRSDSARFRFMFNVRHSFIDRFEKVERILIVAYNRNDKRVVGIMIIREISDELWGLWDIFVAPEQRGRRISSLLYQASYDILRKKGIKKAVGSVETENISSIKSIKRHWDSFLSQKFYEYSGRISETPVLKLSKFRIRAFMESDRDKLFNIYSRCAEEDWKTFINHDQYTFLDRFIEVPFYKGVLRVLFKKHILVCMKNSEIVGYLFVFTHRILSSNVRERVYLFLSPGLSLKDGRLLIEDILKHLSEMGVTVFTIRTINTNENLLIDLADLLEKKYKFSNTTKLVPIITL